MPELLNAVKTTAGKIFQKKRDSAGRVYHVEKGSGKTTREAYAAANKNLAYIVTDDDGRMPAEIREADTAQELEQATEIPFTRDTIQPIETSADSKADAIRAEGNRFLAFWDKNDHLTRDEAAKEYIEFRNKLKNAANGQARGIIKSRYNIGGS